MVTRDSSIPMGDANALIEKETLAEQGVTPSTAVQAPLTPYQAGLWLDWKSNPENINFNTSFQYELIGPLDVDRFLLACRTTYNAIDSFHLRFYEKDGIPYQTYAFYPLHVIFEDVSGSHINNKIETAQHILHQYRHMPFDLAHSSKPRTVLIKLSDTHYYFMMAMHHIISDLAIVDICSKSISQAYNTPDSPLAIGSFLQFAATHDFGDLKTQAPFFVDYLRGYNAPAALMRCATPQEETAFSASLAFSAQTKHQFKQWCRAHRTTEYSALIAIYSVALSRHLDTQDIVIGCPHNIRTPNEQDIIAILVNNLPLRATIQEETSFAELVKQIDAERKKTRAYKQVPLSAIATELKQQHIPTRGLGKFILVEIARFASMHLNDIEAPSLGSGYGLNDGELVFAFDRSSECLECEFMASSRLFDQAGLDQFTHTIRYLLEQLMEEDSRPLHSYPTIPNEETPSIITPPSTNADFDTISHFLKQLAKEPHAAAIQRTDGSSISYQTLTTYAKRLADSFQPACQEATNNPLIGIYTDTGPHAIISMIAAWMNGYGFVFLDKSLPIERLTYITETSGIRHVITDVPSSASSASLPEQCRCAAIPFPIILANAVQEPLSSLPNFRLQPYQTAYVIFTSGSTGKPKGVAVSYRAFNSRIAWLASYFDVKAKEQVLHATHLTFDPSLYEIWWPLAIGATICIPEENERKDPAAILQLIELERIVYAQFVPTFIAKLNQMARRYNTRSLRHLVSGGEALPQAIATEASAAFGSQIYNMYGPTEAAMITSCHPFSRSDTPSPIISIGKPISATECYVLNTRHQLVPFYVPGELYIGGNCIETHYLNNEEEQQKRYVTLSLLGRIQTLFKTGDTVSLHSDGNLYFHERADEQIKLSGYRIELGEIESVATSLPEITGAIALLKEQNGNKSLCLYYTNSAPMAAAAMVSSLAMFLPSYMVPHYLEALDEFPRLVSGKVDRKALAALPFVIDKAKSASGADASGHSHTNDMTHRVASIWQDILHLKHLPAPDSHFFDLGGDSVSAIDSSLMLERALGKQVPVSLLFDHPVLSDFVSHLFGHAHLEQQRILRQIDTDATLDPLLTFSPDAAFCPLDQAQHVLLTGATGFFGNFTLQYLLLHSNAHVYCLVRAANQAEGLERIITTMQAKQLWQECFLSRISVLAAELAEPQLGLSHTSYHSLAEHIDVIIHAAAEVNHVKSYLRLRSANVLGTIQLLKLSATGRAKTFHHISTGSVLLNLGYQHSPYIDERTALDFPDQLPSGYAQSKWVAEKLVQEAFTRGLKGHIYRFGALASANPDIHTHLHELTLRILAATMQMGYMINRHMQVSLVPVEYALKAFFTLANHESPDLHVFHFIDNSIPWHDIREILKENGHPTKLISLEGWLQKLLHQGGAATSGQASSIYSILSEPFPGTQLSIIDLLEQGFFPPLKDDLTQAFLRAKGLPQERADRVFLTRLIQMLKQHLPETTS